MIQRVDKRRRETVSPTPYIESLTREKRALVRERRKNPIDVLKLQKVFVKFKGRSTVTVNEHELYSNRLQVRLM